MIERWGALVVRRAVAVLLVGLAVTALAAVLGVGLEDDLSAGGFDDPGTESARELALERETFGNRSIDAVVIFSSDDAEATDPAFRAEVERTVAAIPEDSVVSVLTWYDVQDPAMVSKDRHATAVYVSLAGESQNDFIDAFDQMRPAVEHSGLRTDLAGPYAVYTDVNEETKSDLLRAELVSMPVVLILSLIIFRSVVAALMPLLVGLVAVLGARATIAGLNHLVDVSIFAPNIITLLGLGLAIDYALFVVSRFREEIAREPADTRGAVVRTMATAGRTVAFSALTVAAAMSSLLVFPQTFLKSIGYGGIAAVLVAMVAALTVLPAVLALLGTRIDALRIPFLQRATPVETGHGAWARLARAVMRRPVVVAAGVVLVLLAVASPFLGVKWGSVDYRVLPADTPSHQASQRLNDEFGPERSTANVLLRGADEEGVAAYTAALGEVPGVVDVRPVATEGDTTLLRAAWQGNSQSDHSQQVVRDLRAVDAPDGADALVGGLTADTVDLAGSVGDHLPLMGLIVVSVMLVLLFLAFGSVVLPLKAVLMNAFSITASFGVVTWIFSDGHLADLLGFTPQGFLDLTNPIVMLAVLFGLSMDYEVFLLSRVREQWDLTGDNDLAVQTGVQKTGRIITSAALLLAVVIGAFSLSGVVFMKMLGLGMLVAILVDATVVRALLVPATMKLLGRWNWWAPAPLARWWERHGFREGGEVSDQPHGRGVARSEMVEGS
ncbi:MMPL family transporter [Nocardioides daeguensis]|uniref:MMPL family transporter n=1 Tax=Nocardioides daeguensis TaxID=908359 RepID=A0ABP6V7S8_9ACTN|nr:MMPL family transporter [Nocardioides daeguensis]MBV6726444.1 MMPL family transporter [Nocardioides daeguensis]MCR1772287.1 MMPL family transporter [Nocardioides daeguensis]